LVARLRWLRGCADGTAGTTCRAPTKTEPRLLELFGHYGELQFGFGEGLDYRGFGVLCGGVAGGGHLADQEVLGAFQHFLFAEGEGLAGAERNEALEDYGDFEERSGAHALGILFEAVLPVMMAIELALFEETENFSRIGGANYGAEADDHRVGLRDHYT